MSKTKVALVGFHLYGGGGARMMSTLSNFFYSKGLDVHVIVFNDELGYEYSGTLFNLGVFKSSRNTIFNKISRFTTFKRYVKKQNFDYIIDIRFRERILQEYLIAKFIYNKSETIYTIHSSKLEVYLPKSKFWANLIYAKSSKIIALTNRMTQAVRGRYPKLLNVITIPNAVDLERIQSASKESINLNFDYIIGSGIYDDNTKQFDKLIKAYAKSSLKSKKVHLVILGRGKLLENLKGIAEANDVSDLVHFLGYTDNPFKFFSKAKYFVLSSLFEGFPMVLLEALASNIPVISFDCPTGPGEIINHKENGLLVEDQNMEDLINAMNLFTEDQELYNHCKKNTLSSVQKFSVDAIGQEWLSLMNISKS